jgi:hypothetical protein
MADRRTYLKRIAAVGTIGALAGCAGDDPAGDGDNSTDDGGDEDSGSDEDQSDTSSEGEPVPARLSEEASEQLLLALVDQGSETVSGGETETTVEYASYSRAVGMGGE